LSLVNSAKYVKPLVIKETTTVKATDFLDGKEFATTSTFFAEGILPIEGVKNASHENIGEAEDIDQKKPKKK